MVSQPAGKFKEDRAAALFFCVFDMSFCVKLHLYTDKAQLFEFSSELCHTIRGRCFMLSMDHENGTPR